MERAQHDHALLSRIAWAYYVNGMTQSDIASWLGTSRVRVNRMLQVCRGEGYVQIMVHSGKAACFEAEKAMEDRFGLRRAIVIPTPPSPRQLNRNLGHAAGYYLAGILKNGTSVGMGWGTTVAAAAASIPRKPAEHLTVVSLYGGLPHSIVINPYEIVTTIARRVQAEQTFYIAAPMFAPTPETCRLLKSQALFKAVYARALQVDVALIGLGELAPDATNVQLGAISHDDVESLERAGAVGEVFGTFVDAEGVPVLHPRNECFMGPDLEEVRAIPHSIAAAGGVKKTGIIRAALSGGFIDVLVTDEETATRLLAQHTEAQA